MADMTRINMRVRGAEVVRVPIDDTLTIEGQAADAKATGDALALKADKSELQAAVKVNNQPADAQGLILIDGRHIPVSDQDTETLAKAVTDMKGKTAADIPMSSDTGAKTIKEVVDENTKAIQDMEGATADNIPMEDGSTVTVKSAIEALDLKAVKTVNRKAPDTDGDVDLSVVPLAENLQSDKMETIDGTFLIRTTGGNSSVSDGKAYPQHILGTTEHTGYVAESLNMTVIPITRTEPDEPITATIDRDTFVAYVDESGTINLYYTTEWSEDPELYGVTVTGDPVAGDQIKIEYTKEERGTIRMSNPGRLIGTGWNLFDYNKGYARVVKYSDEYGYKIGGTYTSIVFSETLTGARSSITPNENGLFNVPEDGYVFVAGGNNTDTYILATWSDWMDGPSGGHWEPYRESGIDMSAVMSTYFPYGLMAVGTVRDEIDLSAKRTISRFERIVYSEESRAAAAATGRAYDFDDNYVYLERAESVLNAITIENEYNVSEHGLEWFTETALELVTEILYGKNLRDKLERDVLTISAQALTAEEQAQVRRNIGVMNPPTNGNGTNGQLLQTNGDGTTKWTTQGTPTDAQVGTAVDAWLVAHPEATTTVEDGSITRDKLNEDLKAKTDAVPELKSALKNIYGILNDEAYVPDKSMFEQGSVTNAGVYVSSNVAIRLKEKIPVKAGMHLTFKSGTNCKRLGLKFFNNDGTVTYYAGWIRDNNPMWICEEDTNLMIVAQKDGTASFAPSDFDAHIEIQATEYVKKIMVKENSMIDIDSYGYFDDYIITQTGIKAETGTPSRPHSVTQYIPVKPGGKILFFFDLHSLSYGMEFCNSSLTVVEFNAMDNLLLWVDVPANAAFMRFTLFKDMPLRNKSLFYLSNDIKLSEFNVTEAGAVGDSKTDNTAVLQRTIDVCSEFDIPIYFPTGKYLITDTLTISKQNTTIFGDDWKMYTGSRIIMKTFEQTVNESGSIVYPTTGGLQDMAENPVLIGFVIKEAGCCVHSMQFIPNFRSQSTTVYDSENLVATGIKIETASQDVDCDIYDCQFRGCNKGIIITGRNAKLHDNTFVHCNTEFEITWNTRHSAEQREIMIERNRFHSCGRNTYGKEVAYDTDRVCIKLPDYVLPNMQREIIIRDNFADYCGVFISGQIYGAQIEGNKAYLCRNSFIKSEAFTYSPVGEGTTYSGTELYTGGSPSENTVIRENTNGELYLSTRSGTILTAPIPVSAGDLVMINASLNSVTYFHGLTDSNGDIIDAIQAISEGNYYLIPENVTGIRIAMKADEVNKSSITIYHDKTTQEISTPYEIYPITIKGNAIVGAEKTDYTPGMNILEESINLGLYKSIIIDGNEFSHGVGDVIVLEKCDKTIITSNRFINAPSYCMVYDENGDLVVPVPEGLNKNYIKMTDCVENHIYIYSNIAMSDKRYDGSDTPYVSTPVSADGEAYQYDNSNKFDHAT